MLINLIWQEYRAPFHSVVAVNGYLNANYNTRIERNRLDSRPLDTFLCWFVNLGAYMDAIRIEEEMEIRNIR